MLVDSNDIRKTKTTDNNKHFVNNDENNANTRSFSNTNEKKKYSAASMKSYDTHNYSTGVLDSDISDSDDAKQEAKNYHYSNKDRRPIMNSKRPPQQHRQRRVENPSFRANPDMSSNKPSINDPVIARMQDRHRNQVRMAAIHKQQMLLEEGEQGQFPRPLYSPSPSSPIPTSPSVASSLASAGHHYPHPHYYQQQPMQPPMMPYMVLAPYPTPMMDPYMYYNHQARPPPTDTSSHASFVSLPASFQPNQHGLYQDQQQENSSARSRSASALPTLTKTRTREKRIPSSQSSSDTELSTPSKDSFPKGFPTLDETDEDPTDADIESDNEDEPTLVGKLRQRDYHHGAHGYTRRGGKDKALEEYFDNGHHCDQKMQAYPQWQQPIYPSPYCYYPSPSYAGMDPYHAQQDRRTCLVSNGSISQE
jgi:hypothetical protein